MGTVRFSGELKEAVKKNAMNIFEAEVKSACENYDPNWGDRIYDTILSQDIQTKMKALPEYCLPRIEHFDIDRWKNAPNEPFSESVSSITKWGRPYGSRLRLKLSSNKAWVHNFGGVPDSGCIISYGDMCLDYTSTKFDWLKPEWEKYAKGIHDVVAKRTTFVSGVEQVMEKFTTLAPALKVFPALWELVPDETKERHKKIREKVVKEVDTSNLDLKSMAATVTFNKLRG
tara:strand:+ start:563 stop:1252 length:690 start_codon:yes stop_codon:yes gene_type:complete